MQLLNTGEKVKKVRGPFFPDGLFICPLRPLPFRQLQEAGVRRPHSPPPDLACGDTLLQTTPPSTRSPRNCLCSTASASPV